MEIKVMDATRAKTNERRKVCNMKLFMRLRLALGCHHAFCTSRQLCLLYKFCAVVISAFTMVHSIYVALRYDRTGSLPASIEYFVFIMIAVIYNDEYIINYFNFVNISDKNGHVKFKKLEKYLKIYLLAMFIVRISILISICFLSKEFPGFRLLLLYNLALIGTDVGCLQIFMICGLLFCRIRLFREALESNGFKTSSKNTYSPKLYMQIYTTICDGFRETEIPIKHLIFFLWSSKILLLFWKTYCSLVDIMQDNKKPFILNAHLLHSVAFAPVPLIIMQLIEIDIKKCMVLIADQLIITNSERQRCEIQELLACIRNQPLWRSILGLVPLNMRLVVISISLFASYMVVMLQFSHVNVNVNTLVNESNIK